MINVHVTEVQAVDADHDLLFTLKMEDEYCCTVSTTENLFLRKDNLEEVLDAVRQGVHMLKLQ